jgi:hypothetical protein
LARLIRAEIKGEAAIVDQMIAGRRTELPQSVIASGRALWPRAAEILDHAPPPADWPDTGLTVLNYQAIARAMAGVLRRAVSLESLAIAEAEGGETIDGRMIADVIAGMVSETAECCAMVVRLALLKSPRACDEIRKAAAGHRDHATRSLLNEAIVQSAEHVVMDLENDMAARQFDGGASIVTATKSVHRLVAMLNALEATTSRARVQAARFKVGKACQERFARAVEESVITPLIAPHGHPAEADVEESARQLRDFEAIASSFGGQASYDRILALASEAVRRVSEAGGLTRIAALRLVEILVGSAIAEAWFVDNQGQ